MACSRNTSYGLFFLVSSCFPFLGLTHNLWRSWSLILVLISNYNNFLDDLIQFQGLNTTSIPLIPEFIFPAQISFLNSRLIKLHAYSANNKHLKFNTSKLDLLLHLQPSHLAIIPSNLSGQRSHSYFCLIFCILAHMQDQQESLLISPPKYIQSWRLHATYPVTTLVQANSIPRLENFQNIFASSNRLSLVLRFTFIRYESDHVTTLLQTLNVSPFHLWKKPKSLR